MSFTYDEVGTTRDPALMPTTAHRVARAFSRPGRWFTRLGGPVVRRLQHRATLDYLESVRAAVAGA